MMDQQPNHRTQTIFRNLKNEWLYSNLSGSLSRKEIVTFLMTAAKSALTPQNFLAAWKNVGMRPWNPSKLTFGGSLQYYMPKK